MRKLKKSSADKNTVFPDTQKYSPSAIVLLILLQIFIVLISNSRLSGEDDLFWYLSTGRYIVQHGSIPSADVFGFTTAGAPWIPFEWGWDIIIYYLYNIGGFLALHIFSTAIILIIFNLIILNLVKLKVNLPLIVICLLIFTFGIALRLTVKPHLISYLAMALLLTIIIKFRYINRGSFKPVYFIPFIFLVWINMHMGVLSGLFLLGLFFTAELLSALIVSRKYKSDIRPLSPNEIYKLGLIIFISALITLVNPHGIKTFEYALHIVSMKQLEIIYEWASPFSSIYLFTFSNYIYYIFISGLTASVYYSVKQKDPLPVLLAAGFFIYSLSAARLTVDFMLVSVLFFAVSVNYIVTFSGMNRSQINKQDKISEYLLIGIVIVIIILIPANHLYKITGYSRTFGYGIDENNFPVKMFSFMKENNIQDLGWKPFNSYETGGFFIWNFPQNKNFIGSRGINDDVWYDYTNILNLQTGFEEKIDSLEIDYFMWMVPFLNYAQYPAMLNNGVLSYLFSENRKWKLIFWNDNSFLFVKNNNEFQNVILKHDYKYLTPFNLYFNPQLIKNGYNEDSKTIKNEIQRRLSEDPTGTLTKKLLKFLEYPNY